MDTVRVGSGSVTPSLFVPGTFAHESYKVEGGNRTFMSRTTQTVERGPSTIVIRTIHAASSDTGRSLTVVRAADLALVHHGGRVKRSGPLRRVVRAADLALVHHQVLGPS